MDCCANCFGSDVYIHGIIEKQGQLGNCPRCGASTVRIASTQILTTAFEFLMTIYEESNEETGKPITDCLIADWEIFKGLDRPRSLQLVADILNQPEIRTKFFVTTEYKEITPKQKWINFCDELVNEYRFFPTSAPDIEYLPLLFQHLVISIESPIYRARIETERRYKKAEMGMPPKSLTPGGRANPVGIPYFYGASNIDTAIAETRPHPGNKVSIAKFNLTEPLRLINLMAPREMISPLEIAYQQGDEDYLLKLRYDVEFLAHLGEVLSTPITPHAAQLEYLPTQYLCELIKKSEFDGLMFNSSVGNGKNFALFNETKLKPVSVITHKVTTLMYQSQKLID